MIQTIEQLAIQTSHQLAKRSWKLAVVESCTGGGLAYYLTEIPGSSAWFERGWVTYSNQAKQDLGVSPHTLSNFGAVSEQTAREMAENGLKQSQADVCISITGIAGPDGGSDDKPVGMVWFGWAGVKFETKALVDLFPGSRHEIRLQSIKIALTKLLEFV